MRDADCVALLQWALPRVGLHWPGFRKVRRQVCARIERHARALGLPDAASYRRYLEAHEREWHDFAPLCTVSISRFHRDRAVFAGLASEVLPALAVAALGRGSAWIECWSAGCASGEEPYSLAIAWRAALQPRFPTLRLRVLGTDVDGTLIERARAGCYGASSLRELPAPWRDRAFDEREGLFCLREEMRRDVRFERADLRVALPRREFDLILCRNLAFTYFGPELARATLDRLATRLRPGGALVIGQHEKLPADAGRFEGWPGCRAAFRLRDGR